MTSAELALAERFRGQIAELDRSVARVSAAWTRARTAVADQDLFLDAAALSLHGFYSGVERLFELTARHIDNSAPDGEAWRRELPARMAQPAGDTRPAVISPAVASALDEYRRFRYLVLNAYATDVVADRMRGLVERLRALWPRLRADLLAFAAFLECISVDDPCPRAMNCGPTLMGQPHTGVRANSG